MKKILVMAAMCAAVVTGPKAEAQDRTLNVKAVSGWEAVGRLNLANRAMCTGALIAPNMVLTAAHCLFDPYNGSPVKAKDIRFEAGLTGLKFKAARQVEELVIHPEYRHNHGGPNDIGVDLAILKLATPIAVSDVRPFAMDARPEAGDALGVISYTHTQKTRPILQHPCEVLTRKGDLLVMNCEVDFGASGAPVFAVQAGDRPRLVSVISSKAELGNRAVSVGTVLEEALQVLLRRAG